jgi:rhamnopyranosyl-N-acetylglucosaminyl-diphospho-decaprenol beta-1,3/1,4-galactofuranosyltransferase
MQTDPAVDGFAGRTTVVVVTFNRAEHLDGLLASLVAMRPEPGRVVVVDNASTDDTPALLARWQQQLGERLVVLRQQENSGGAGGFSAGVEAAHRLGAEWMWLMDDDVTVLPDALARLAPWTARFRCITGRRYDFDGRPFRWQNRFSDFLGVPLALRGDPYGSDGWFEQTAGNFEGMLVHRDVVDRIGLPDPRFFIVWDDAVYGWLAHRVAPAAVVDEFVMRRARVVQQREVGSRNLNATSDLYRFHVMRNRALIYLYLREHGALHRLGFGLGTAYTFGKEVVRLLLVERKVRGVGRLVSGYVASRRMLAARDDWAPMPSLGAGTR